MNRVASVKNHFNKIAVSYDYYKNKNSFYYDNLKKLLSYLIPKGKKVLEVGCGTGDLLFSLRPKYGYGMDISGEMIKRAKSKYGLKKNLTFFTKWPKGNLPAGRQEFDCIFMSDVIEHLENPKETFRKVSKMMDNKTIFVCTMANQVWEPILMLAEKLKLKIPEGKHKRLRYRELRKEIEKLGLKIVKHDYKLLVPVKIPFVTKIANRYLENTFKKYAFIEYFTAAKS